MSAILGSTNRFTSLATLYPAGAMVIAANTADGADAARISICGGGGPTADVARGGFVQVCGNESGSTGSVFIRGGNVANGSIQTATGGNDRWQIPYNAAATTTELVFGNAGYSNVSALIRAATNDGSDNSILSLCAGGGSAATRGAAITLYGNENSSGSIYITPGAANGGANIRCQIQDITGIASAAFEINDANYNGRRSTKIKTTNVTGFTGASMSAASFIPAGAYLYGIVARVTTAITGTATSWQLGDGTTADLWATGKALALGTTVNSTDFKSTWNPKFYSAANNVVFTAVGGTFSAGAVRITAIYDDMTGPSA